MIRKKIQTEEGLAPITSYTLAELMLLYRRSRNTVKGWILRHEAKIGPREGNYYTQKQIKILFDCIGHPDDFPKPEIKTQNP